MNESIQTLQTWLDESSSIVFFGGAGVSLDSGIPDFRHTTEALLQKYLLPPESILSRAFFERRPGPFFRFYRDQVLEPLITAVPNETHHKLVELEAAGRLRMTVTQNMDDFHQEAGSRKVIELFGSVMRNSCANCEQRYSALDILEKPGIPYCDVDMCGEVMTPEIFLYGDAIKKELVTDAVYHILSADLFIVAGTSLLEYPAAGFVQFYDRKKMVLINDGPTLGEARANLVIHAPIQEVMGQLRVTPKE